MKKHFYPALILMILFTVLLGIIYPWCTTFVAQKLFPFQAGGSLVYEENIIVGSELIGQEFTINTYFWSRPSASNYNPLYSGGTNYSPINVKLQDQIAKQTKRFNSHPNIPEDLLLSSGSGLDPHILLNSAIFQIPRLSSYLHLDEKILSNLVYELAEKKSLGILGQDRVNVLKLNRVIKKRFNH